MIIMNHLLPKLQLHHQACLLNNKTYFGNITTENIGKREGCYLYRKKKHNIFICSGKISDAKGREKFLPFESVMTNT